MRVFVSAARAVRAEVSPALINGFQMDVPEGARKHTISVSGARPAPLGGVVVLHLVARPTGQTYQGLPWWEADHS